MTAKGKVSLVLADVDGTLVTEDKVLTKRVQAAVSALQDAGIYFAITSGRPPLGMAMLLENLSLDTPLAGFNGGLFVTPELAVIERRTLPTEVAARSIELIHAHRSEEHTSELQSLMRTSYAVLCLKQKN